ncbi:MAG: hypothetical protein WBD34_10225 [Burkholderiaceae bacterium]
MKTIGASSASWTVLFFVMIAWLSGCTTLARTAESIAPERPHDNSTSGILVVHVDTHVLVEGAYINFRRIDEEGFYTLNANGIDPQPVWNREKGVKGRVFGMSLPPGSYEVFGWRLFATYHGARRGGGGPYYNFHSLDAPPVPFEIRAGEATYIGHYTIDATPRIQKGLLDFGPWIKDAHASITDNFSADKQGFFRQYPDMSNTVVRNSAPSPDHWKGVKVRRGN